MLYQLLRFDLVWRSAVRLSLFAAAAGLALSAWSHKELPGSALFLCPLLLVSPLMLSSPHVRTGVAIMALPLTGRQIFTVRAVSILSLLWLPFLSLLAALMTAPGLDANNVSIGFMFMSGLTAVSCYLLTRNMGEAAAFRRGIGAAGGAMLAVLVMAVAGAVGTLVAILKRVPDPTYSAPIGVAALLFATWRLANAWPRTPLAFQLVSNPDESRQDSTPFTAAAPFWWLYQKMVWSWTDLFLLPYLVFFPMMPAFGPLAFVALAGNCPMMLRSVQALPLDPRRVVLGRLAAILMLAALGIGGYLFIPGTWITWFTAPHTIMATEQTSRQGQLITPLAYWQRTDAMERPLVEAPWGERAYPPVQRFMGVAVYNPYFTANGSSPRFLDWQFSRATAAYCGVPQPRSIEAQRHGWKNALLSARFRLLVVSGTLIVGAWFYWLGMAQLWYRLNRRFQGAKSLRLILQFAVVIAVPFSQAFLDMSAVGFGKDDSSVQASLTQLWAVRMDGAFANPLALAAAVLGLLAVPVFLVWRQARELEVESLPMAARKK